jgi:hypothetical protein
VPAVLFLLRAVVLVLLWGFVVAIIVAVRHDIFGTKRAVRRPAPTPTPSRPPARAPAAASSHRRPRQLVVIDGNRAGHAIPLSDLPITIGRAEDSTLVLTDDYVSTHHARLVPRNDGWLVEDLGSTNGTYVDRRRVTALTPVPPGAKLRIGKTVLELRG